MEDRKFIIKEQGEEIFYKENLKYYNLIKKVYDRFDGKDYTKSSMGAEYIFYNTLIKFILNNKPKFILELGSGYTTYLMGTLIQDYNLDTKLLSLENDKKWYDWIKKEKLDPLDSVVMSDLESWNKDGKVFVKYTYDYNLDEVDYIVLDGPGHFEHEFEVGECQVVTKTWPKDNRESHELNITESHTHTVKRGINYNYCEILEKQNKPVAMLIDGRHDTRKFYENMFTQNQWSKKYIRTQDSIFKAPEKN